MTDVKQGVTPDKVNQDGIDNNKDQNTNASVPSARLREEAEKRREAEARIAQLEAEKDELTKAKEQELADLRKDAEDREAIAKYGETIVRDEKVQEIKAKYAGMSYDEAIKLAGKEPKQPMGGFVAQNPSIDQGSTVYYYEDLSLMPRQERQAIYAKQKSGEVQIKWKG